MITGDVVADALAPATIPGDINRMIEAATATLGQELGRFLDAPTEIEERHNGGYPFVLLYDDPVIDENAVLLVETRTGPVEPWEAVDAEDYVVEGRRVVHRTCWPRGLSSVRVTYTRGYELNEGPAQLRDIVLELVLAKIRNKGREGLTSETIGDYSYTKADLTQLDAWPTIAARWRRNRL
jgi:hypothetical protein